MDIFLQQLINGLVLGSVYALVALGYTMVYGIMELINFAHGEVTMMGAMVALAVIGAIVASGVAMPVLLVVLCGLAAAVLVCAALGFAIERIAYRPLRNAPRLAPLITAILVSWGIAFAEYCFQVPANRIGHRHFEAAQLKIMQEVITLTVFVPFSVMYLKEPLKLDYLWAALCLLGAVFFMFRNKFA